MSFYEAISSKILTTFTIVLEVRVARLQQQPSYPKTYVFGIRNNNLSVFNRYEKKNLFNVKYASVYLMLNALMMKSYDYKSIALPAELQGLVSNDQVFSLKDQINQSLKRLALMLAAVAARTSVQCCSRIVPILSVFLSALKSVFIQDFINAFSFIKTNKSWSGIYEKEQRQINKVY